MLLPFQSLINTHRMINYKHHNPKQIVSTVAFVLEGRLKLKVYEVRLSL